MYDVKKFPPLYTTYLPFITKKHVFLELELCQI